VEPGVLLFLPRTRSISVETVRTNIAEKPTERKDLHPSCRYRSAAILPAVPVPWYDPRRRVIHPLALDGGAFFPGRGKPLPVGRTGQWFHQGWSSFGPKPTRLRSPALFSVGPYRDRARAGKSPENPVSASRGRTKTREKPPVFQRTGFLGRFLPVLVRRFPEAFGEEKGPEKASGGDQRPPAYSPLWG
jgi:hypothetical protein